MHAFKNHPSCCPSCMKLFNFKISSAEDNCRKYPKRKRHSTKPHLLSCGHNLCEECLRSVLKCQSSVPCPVCRETTILPDGGEDAVSKVPLDLYMGGIILASSLKGPENISKLPKMVPVGHSLTNVPSARNFACNLPSGKADVVDCEECSSSPSVWRCHQCASAFCTSCFANVHKISKILSKHKAIPIEQESTSSCRITHACEEHGITPEFYCIEDDHLVCSYCLIMGSHKNHSNMTLKEKNKSYLEEINELVESVQKVSKNLKKAEKVLNSYTRPQSSTDSLVIIKNIHKVFQQLHGLLQIREHKLIDEITELYDIHNLPIEKLKTEVTNSSKGVKAVLKDVELAMETPEKFDVQLLVKKLQQMSNIPCYLTHVTEQELDDDIRFEISKEIVETFNSIGSITGKQRSKFRLLNHNELPPDYKETQSDDEESVMSDVPSSLSTSEVDILMEQQLLPSLPNDINNQQNALNVQLFKQEMVYVTHIVTPHLFMVQRTEQLNNLIALSKSINSWCENKRKESCKALTMDSVNKGDLVLAQYTKDNLWYRARITKLLNNKSEESEMQVEVIYIDFGNSEELPLSRLCMMEEQFMHLSELALKCSLFDIVPKFKKWSPEAIHMMRMFTGDKQVHMSVMEEIGGIFQVDLHRPPALNLNIHDVPVSVRDALVFLDFAYYDCPETNNKIDIKPHSQQQYLTPLSPIHNKSLNVAASYVIGPHSFYVQQIDDYQNLSSLMFNMQEKYSADSKKNLWTIFCPQPQMPCVAQYSHDRQWYRAQVEELPGDSKVRVKYVDYGNEEIIQWSSLKKIADEYLKLPIQAIPCSLVDVEPVNGASWSSKACKAFSDMLVNKKLKIHIKGKEFSENKNGYNVILYETKDDTCICINTLLVQKGFAKSTGPNSTILKFGGESKEYIRKPINPKTNQEKPVKILSPPRPKPMSMKRANYPEMVVVKVTSITSPDCLYVQLVGDNEDDLNRLMQDMHRTYQNSEAKCKDWNAEQFVAAKSVKDQKWYRARILQKEENNLFKVFTLDYGRTETVPMSNLRVLLDRFHTKHVFAICCCLVGIQPAGGTKTWTAVACERLQDIIHAHDKFYMAKKDNLKEGHLSVDLYLEIFQSGGALEPHLSTFQSVTDMLVEQGVALRIKRAMTPSGDPSNEHSLLISCDDLNQQTMDDASGHLDDKENKNTSISSLQNVPDTSTTIDIHHSESVGEFTEVCKEDETLQSMHENETVVANKNSNVSKMVNEMSVDNFNDYDDEDNSYDDLENSSIEDENYCILAPKPLSPDCRELNSVKTLESESSTSKIQDLGSSPLEIENKSSVDLLQLPSVPRQNNMWKKCELPSETVFTAVVTYIDYDCCLYVHNVAAQPTLDLIKSTLKCKYNGSEPEAHDFYWLTDEPCIAEYHIDQCWYRAQVRKVTDTGIEVIFIDYGNTEVVDLLKVRKKLACTGIPRQSLKCMLYQIEPISPDKHWPEPVLEYLHQRLVDQKVTVILKEAPVKEPLQVSIVFSESKESIEDILVSLDLAKRLDTPQTNLPSIDYNFEHHEDNIMEFGPYHTCNLPLLGEKINVTIINVEFPSIVWVQRKKIEKPINKRQKLVNEECDKFLELCKNINMEVHNWLPMSSIKIGDAVCCKYSIDDQWYRGSVLDITPVGYQVLYVDYGNQAVLTTNEIREIPKTFLSFPMQAIRCQLHQLAPTNGQWTEDLYQELQTVIARHQEDVICCIKELSRPVKVDLFKSSAKDNFSFELVYQELVDSGIMTLVREKTPEELL